MSEVDQMQTDMDINNLYTEEILTDRKMGTMHILTPVDCEGKRDMTRAMIFTGEVQLMTQMGPLPISFEIPAETVPQAIKMYGEAAKDGIRQTIERLQEMRREAQNRIVTPGTPGFNVPPAPGSKIQMP